MLTLLIRLLALPVIWMGSIQLIFAVLSIAVFRDGVGGAFWMPATIMLVLGSGVFMSLRRIDLSRTNVRTALLFTALTWALAGLLDAIPIMLVTHISLTDAVFESISALTTTGATVLSGLDQMPPTFLLYRQFLQWVGGLGIVIFVVAVLPMMNVGGMRLLMAETPGPIKDDKLSPRVAKTAHALWIVYILLTLACALAYFAGGMSAFDAIAHSFTTVSTGGFSTHDASMGHFQSQRLMVIADLFMILGAINFALHFRAVSNFNLSAYLGDEETRMFLLIIAVISASLAAFLIHAHPHDNSLEMAGSALFLTISFITSTGFGADNFVHWPTTACVVLIIAGFVGGCAGSTAGGNKVVRSIISVKVVLRSMRELIHPNGMFTVRYQGRPLPDNITSAVGLFMFCATVTTLLFSIALMGTGLDWWSAFSAVAACVNVLGPAFGTLGSNFAPVSDLGTWILSLAMLLGRLEYLTVFILLTPSFWKA